MLEYFSNVLLYVQCPKASLVSSAPDTFVCPPCYYCSLQETNMALYVLRWHNTHTKFRENRSIRWNVGNKATPRAWWSFQEGRWARKYVTAGLILLENMLLQDSHCWKICYCRPHTAGKYITAGLTLLENVTAGLTLLENRCPCAF